MVKKVIAAKVRKEELEKQKEVAQPVLELAEPEPEPEPEPKEEVAQD